MTHRDWLVHDTAIMIWWYIMMLVMHHDIYIYKYHDMMIYHVKWRIYIMIHWSYWYGLNCSDRIRRNHQNFVTTFNADPTKLPVKWTFVGSVFNLSFNRFKERALTVENWCTVNNLKLIGPLGVFYSLARKLFRENLTVKFHIKK